MAIPMGTVADRIGGADVMTYVLEKQMIPSPAYACHGRRWCDDIGRARKFDTWLNAERERVLGSYGGDVVVRNHSETPRSQS